MTICGIPSVLFFIIEVLIRSLELTIPNINFLRILRAIVAIGLTIAIEEGHFI